MISVVIPVKNGGDDLRRCLEAIGEQQAQEEVEVVIVDSGSVDGSQALARSLGARVHEIAPTEFNHGATRNLGAELAHGETIVFTVDDALPVGPGWLEALTAPLREDNGLAGTYSRQVAHDDAPAHQRYYLDSRYGRAARTQRLTSPAQATVSDTLFSNVSSAVRRPVLERFPFASEIVTAEDLEWCRRVLLAGYEVAYVPDSVVRHSHRFTLRSLFKRYFDQGAAAEQTMLAPGQSSLRAVRGEGLRHVRSEFAWMWRSGRRGSIPQALAFELTRYVGFRLGAHYRLIPRLLRRRWSMLPTHWS